MTNEVNTAATSVLYNRNQRYLPLLLLADHRKTYLEETFLCRGMSLNSIHTRSDINQIEIYKT